MSSGKKTNLALKLGKSKPEEFDALVRLATDT